jgi:phosphoserine phosphatase
VTGPPFRSIWFDCDSTLSRIEGVDELAREVAPALRAEIQALTERAMNGELPLADVYEARLERIAPTRDLLARIGARYVEQALPDAALAIAALRSLGKTVGIVSGGLLPPVLQLAGALGVPATHVLAVPVRFDPAGAYAGIDRACPLWRNGGKPELLHARPPAERPLAFVGDGITDLEAAPVADRFVGFGGIVRRAAVEARAAYYVTAPRLAAVLPLLLTGAERARLAADPAFAALDSR